MPQVHFNGAKFAYEEMGNGEPLVFVHGSASDRRTWHYQKEELAEQFRVISYSRRYHWPDDYRLTDRLEELLPHSEQIEIPKASHIMTLFSHSLKNTVDRFNAWLYIFFLLDKIKS